MIRPIRRIFLLTLALALLMSEALAGETMPDSVFRALYGAIPEHEREGFLFFTDPHMAETDDWEPSFEEYMRRIAERAENLELSLVLCGGDWIGTLDTNAEAMGKLSRIADFNLGLFGERTYHCAVGNHDTNELGAEEGETRRRRTASLSIGQYTNAMMPLTGMAYEAFDGDNTRFYVLDTGYEGQEMNYRGEGRYRWSMLRWFADDLKQNDPRHAAILMHIFYRSSRTHGWGALGKHIVSICEAFNRRSMYKADGHVFDFRECTGRVEFALCGHIHTDYSSYPKSFPVICTRNALAEQPDGSSVLSYDLIAVDYRERLITLLRVGDGESRTVSLDP